MMAELFAKALSARIADQATGFCMACGGFLLLIMLVLAVL